MDRRHFLLGMASSLLVLRAQSLHAVRSESSQEIPLWEGAPPGGGGPLGNAIVSGKGALHNISQPSITRLRPTLPNGHAVLIAAGGGYKRIEMASEAWPAARWLTARGYTAYILKYRLPGEGWQAGNLVALQDAQRALRIIRQHEDQVSVLGFSAGGHLVGLAATRPDFQSYRPVDAYDKTLPVADRMALIYPIVTLEKPYQHTSAHRVLVGPGASDAADAAWSVQNFVTPHTPSTFLVQAEDDPVSNPQNTLIMANACKKAGVAVEMHRYAHGGHGFGMGKPGTPTAEWPDFYQSWLAQG